MRSLNPRDWSYRTQLTFVFLGTALGSFIILFLLDDRRTLWVRDAVSAIGAAIGVCLAVAWARRRSTHRSL